MTIKNIAFEDVLTIVGPPAGLLQLVASGWEDEYAFFRKIATGDWLELRNEKVQPGFWRFLTTRPANVAFFALRMVMAERKLRVRRDQMSLGGHSPRVRSARSQSARARHRAGG
jgi:hypothetical protein